MSRHNRSARRRAYNIPGHAHELTFSTYQRYPFLRADRCCGWLADSIAVAREKQAFWVWSYVFMPDHVHLLLNPHGPA
jgi:putative transposase